MGRVLVLAVALVLASCSSQPRQATGAPTLAALRGDYFALASRQTQRQYHIHVRLPEGYDPGKAATYPVVYVLDGDSLFPLLAPTHLFLQNDEKIPAVILVGIAYGSFEAEINKRDVDFTAAGAPSFKSFLKEELIPRVERSYKADPTRRLIIGQSLAGHFVLWSAVEDPDLFWASIASNASYLAPRETMLRATGAPSNQQGRVAVVSGTRDYQAERMQYATDWVRHWTSQPIPPWTVRHFVIENGTHAASIGLAYRDVMVWLFKE